MTVHEFPVDDIPRIDPAMPYSPPLSACRRVLCHDDEPPDDPAADRIANRLRALAVEVSNLPYLAMLRLAREVLGREAADETVVLLANMLAGWAEETLNCAQG